jgi:galactokinase
MQDEVIDAYRKLRGRLPEIVARAPGRVNLLGAHVDYNDGWVLPAAIDRAVYVAASATGDGSVRIASLVYGQEGETSLELLRQKEGAATGGDESLSWLNYPAGVAWAMMDAGHALSGLDAVFNGDVPVGGGVSSSAAVEVAFILAWEALSDLMLSGRDKALLGQRAENHYLGVNSGIMDQFASLHGSARRIIWLDCRSLDYELLPMPEGTAVLVADSGVRRELAQSEYNLRRQQCQEAVDFLKEPLPHIRALRDVTRDDLARYGRVLPELLRSRAEHVVHECGRVLDGVELLRRGDVEGFGHLIRRSHTSSRDLYEVSIPELDTLAWAAWQVDGCYGARLTGAGFGGCVIALVDEAAGPEVARFMGERFEQAHSQRPSIFTARIGPGAACERLRPEAS